MVSVKKMILFCLVIMTIRFPVIALATNYCEYEIVEISLPEDLLISVSEKCAIHQNFHRVATNQEGGVAVYSRKTENTGQPDYSQYIDLYNPDGVFSKEIHFSTPLPVEIALTKEALIIYFHVNILTYDLKTETFHYYALPDGTKLETDFLIDIRNRDLDCGNWDYSLAKELDGYKALSRVNVITGEKQVLVSYAGSGRTALNMIIAPIIVSVFIFILGIRKKQK